MDTPDREAKSLSHHLTQRTIGGKVESQVVVIAKDKAGTDHQCGYAKSIPEAFDLANAYVAKNLKGYHI